MGGKTRGLRRVLKYSPLKEGYKKMKEPYEQQLEYARETQSQQMEEIKRQEMMEQARISEEEDRIKRKRSRMLTGGRSLLIGTSPMGTQNELGGGACMVNQLPDGLGNIKEL